MQQSRQWPLRLINFAGRVFTWLTFGVFFRIERRGGHHLPRTGGVMIISNHMSWFDPILLNLVLRRAPHWLAMVELFKTRFSHWFFTHAGVIPIDRSQPGSAPLKEAIRLLRAGRALVVFPEGGIHHGPHSVLGGDPEIKEGAALIAVKAGVPIVPAIIEGARQTYVKQNWFFRRCTIRLTLGEVFHLPPHYKRDGAHAGIREKLLALAAEAGQPQRG
jgi:1-acyl-sn-glycerol-3-phosphate acyltransferase